MVEYRESNENVSTSTSWKHYNAGKPRDPLRPFGNHSMGPDYLVPFYLVTAGKFGEELGCDESPVLLVNYAIHDVTNNKVLAVQQKLVRPIITPGHADSENEARGIRSLTDDCIAETGFTDDIVENAPGCLEQALEEMDRFLRQKGVHPDTGGKTFTLVTDGQLHMRLVLHPEACGKQIDLTPYPFLYRFYDVRKEFKRFYKKGESSSSLKEILEQLDIAQDESVEYGVRKCQDMCRIISSLINDGHRWGDPEVVNKHYYHAIVKKTDLVDDDVVVRTRGLPWQATDSDINRFFRGLNIERGGIALVLSKVGRRNGEALVRFVDKEHRDLAIRKHKHHMSQRYIEVYVATGRDFIAVAGGETKEAEDFLQKLTDPNQTLVRMRGLPYTATADQILEFFANANCPVQFDADGILFVNHKDGRATGDAFVIFPSEVVAERALLSHRQHIGTRYIELFKSTPAEVNQVMNTIMNPPPPEPDISTQNGLVPVTPLSLLNPSFNFGSAKGFIRVRGMPVDAMVADILSFLEHHSQHIVYQGVHLVYNALGQPAGEAIIQMTSDLTAMAAVEAKHKKMFYLTNGKRSQVDVVMCSPSEVSHFAGLTTNSSASINSGTTTIPNPAAAMAAAALFNRPTLLSPATAGTALSGGSLPAATSFGLPGYQLPSATPTLLPTANASHTLLQSAVNPLAAAAARTYQPLLYANAMYPTAQAASHPGWTNYSPPVTSPLSPAQAAAAAVAVSQANQQLTVSNGTSGYYMTPTVQPSLLNTVIIKGLPKDALLEEILGLFDGVIINGMIPDVKIGLTHDNLPSGEAYITFHTRLEAERAIGETSRKFLRNHCVDLMLAHPGVLTSAL